MARITHPDGVLRNAIYTFRSGDSAAARRGTVHVLTPNTTFRRRDGETHQTLLHGFEYFDAWGAHGFLSFEEVGVVGNAPGCELTFFRMATSAEIARVEEEAKFHTKEHMKATACLLAQDFLTARGSIVEAVGVYGALGRDDIWPGDYDVILFVSQRRATTFLLDTLWLNRRGRPSRKRNDGKCMPSVLVEKARLPDHLVSFLRLDEETVQRIEWRLRGNLTPDEAGSRLKKLDLQVLPLSIGESFRGSYHDIARDPDFLRRIHPDIQVFDPEANLYTKERAQRLVSWEL